MGRKPQQFIEPIKKPFEAIVKSVAAYVPKKESTRGKGKKKNK